jgi:hypothetical protein
MTTLTLSAEKSVYKSSLNYRTGSSLWGSDAQVLPQRINLTCYFARAERTYQRCMSLGSYSANACNQVAIGVAASVCDDGEG